MIRRLLVIAAAVAIPMGMIVVGGGVSGAAAKTPDIKSVNARSVSGIKKYYNSLASNTKGWCNGEVPPNAPCDGGVNDYGTIDIVKATYSNSGGYACGGQSRRQEEVRPSVRRPERRNQRGSQWLFGAGR